MARSTIKVHTAEGRQSLEEMAYPLTHRVLDKLRVELDEAFDRFSRHLVLPSVRRVFDIEHRLHHGMPLSSIGAAADVSEEEKLFRISVELPGVEANSIEVAVSDNTLTIKGEKRDEKETDTRNHYLREREYGSFERFIELPAGIDHDKTEAEFANGVLTILLPKTHEAVSKRKKIPVKNG